MNSIGKYYNREVIWIAHNDYQDKLPDNNWICLAIGNQKPNFDEFEKFVRYSISKNILEFKAHGLYGEALHDYFDEIIGIMEVMENHSEIEVMTTWHNDETLADAFWQSFYATCLPENADLENLKVVCIDFDGAKRTEELKTYIDKFEKGWLP